MIKTPNDTHLFYYTLHGVRSGIQLEIMIRFNPPDQFDFSKPHTWPDWKQRWNRFFIASEMDKKSKAVQVSSLLYSMGQQSETVFQAFIFGEDESEDEIAHVLKKFDLHFVPSVNRIHERAKFHSRNQQAGENVETYLRSLYKLIESCGYNGTAKDEAIRDQLVVGISDKECSQKLQLKEDLKLAEAIEICRTSELVKNQMANQKEAAAIEAVRVKGRTQQPRHKQLQQRRPPSRTPSGTKCGNCAKVHQNPNYCPAKGKKCNYCKKTGHFAIACRKKSRHLNEVEQFPQYSDYDNDELPEQLFLGAIDCGNSAPWLVSLHVNNLHLNFKLDTGADITCIPKLQYQKLKPLPALQPSFMMLSSPAGQVNCIGQFQASVKHKGKVYNFPICVIESKTSNCLLSRNVASAMGFVKLVESINDDVFGEFGLMKTDPVRISLKSDAVPYNLATPRRVSEPLLQPVKDELDRMVKHDIISPIKDATEWCAPMVPVLKKNNKVRICVDLKKLNQSVQRERFVMPTVDEIASKLANAKVFTTLDCSQSFWQLPLDQESRKLTSFITPFGRYIFNRLPYGLNSSTEIFQRTLKELLNGIDGVIVDVDDILIFAPDVPQHDVILNQVLQRIIDSGLKLNRSKCKFRCDRVVYQGQVFSSTGMSADPTKVSAIQSLKPPQNITELRRIVGMVNYLARYVPNLSQVMHPMLELLKSDNAFVWQHPQQKAFEEIKQLLTSDRVLSYYDMSKATFVSADASSYGLGACLMQEFNGELMPIAYASRSLTVSERKWAQIDKECLALVWACEKFSHYLVGLPQFKLITDHKPLVPLINTKDLDRTPIRVQRLLMRLLRFNCIAEYTPGKTLIVADALSRSCSITEDVSELVSEIELYVHMVEKTWPISDTKLKEIADETAKDATLCRVSQYVINGWPDYYKDVSVDAQPYFANRYSLSMVNGVLTYLDRIVIPGSMQNDILEKLHSSHQGIVKSKQLASYSVWWPTVNADVQNKCQTCNFCEENKPAKHHEPLMPTELPDGPWHTIGIDAFEFQQLQYLTVVDYYSRYIFVLHLPDLTSRTIILKLKSLFATHGIPYTARTDGAKYFTSKEFNQFSAQFDFTHVTSSPHFPQSNGQAESAVKIAKRCLKQPDPFIALMLYRATPHTATGKSPAQLFLGRQIRTTIPTVPQNLVPRWPDDMLVRQRDAQYKVNMARHYNKRHNVRQQVPFAIGQQLRMKTKNDKHWQPVIVHEKARFPRSYVVKTQDGKSYRRNTRHLMPCRSSARTPVSNREGSTSVLSDYFNRKIISTRRPESSTDSSAEKMSQLNRTVLTNKPVTGDKVCQSVEKPATNSAQQPTSTYVEKRTRSGRLVKPVDRLTY